MSVFADAFLSRQFALDSAFGEKLEIHHTLRGEFSVGGDDTSIQVFTVAGILDTPDIPIEVKGVRLDASRAQVEVPQYVASFGFEVFDTGKPRPVKGTRIVAIEQPGSPVYTVDAPPQSDGLSRLLCKLKPI